MTGEWDAVERELAQRERHAVFRTAIAALRPVIEWIKADDRLVDLRPSVSLGSLVFRRGSGRAVLLHWNEQDGYRLSHLAPGFEIVNTRQVAQEDLVDVLRVYLDDAVG